MEQYAEVCAMTRGQDKVRAIAREQLMEQYDKACAAAWEQLMEQFDKACVV
jgi:hypothetical protein